ncbi:patatin-like phospholipase family protein [Halomonas sp. Bachu 37]|uniref:patatin-like phospholipase family protein n=1 Tax=Halomonas kashgarensis TaxID=3084920 RepID=UPI003217E0FF
MAERTTLILSGGNALGAYQAGAYETLHERGMRPDEIFAVSTGAINAALIAGTPAEKRVDALRDFWDSAVQDGVWGFGASCWPKLWHVNRSRALQSLLFGSPAFYRLRLPGALSGLPGAPPDAGIYDLAPLRESLERSIDFDRLNDGQLRVVIVAVDAHSGEEVRFDSAETPIGVEHLLASGGFLPFFPPTQVDGRLLVDGGMASNLPLEAALEEPTLESRLCIALDLFSRRGAALKTVGQAVDRQLELLLSAQTWRALQNLERTHELRRQLRQLGERIPEALRDDPTLAPALKEGARADGATTLLLLSHGRVEHDTEMRAFDFSRRSLSERWETGRADMAQTLDMLGSRRAGRGEFAVHAYNGRGADADETTV